jgi:hypothetical protein
MQARAEIVREVSAKALTPLQMIVNRDISNKRPFQKDPERDLSGCDGLRASCCLHARLRK